MSLYRLIESGRLSTEVEYIAYLTDGGSDNVGWLTHALNLVLVREGTFNILEWLRLRPGHSHNKQDLTFAQLKAIFFPKAGAGPGCCGPMQYHQMIVEGLKNTPGDISF